VGSEYQGLKSANDLTWCEVNIEALENNIRSIKRRLSDSTLIAPAVKSNAYGHGLLSTANAFLRGGADWLCVHTLEEALTLRRAGITCPIYLFGPILTQDLMRAASLRLHLVLYQESHLEALKQLAIHDAKNVSMLKLHLKIETGNHRQGISLERALSFTQTLKNSHALNLVGVTSHFANIEDTTNHSFAEQQFKRLLEASEAIEALWGQPLMQHIANSAATLLWPTRTLSLARVGLACYGLWPSQSVRDFTAHSLDPPLTPALSWRARIVQIKLVAKGLSVGYGCTYTTTRPTRLALVPVGYFEGYDRGLSNRGQVIILGSRAPIIGRICMNICMVDVTDLPQADEGDIVTLIGRDGQALITADQIAQWTDTINYEVISRIAAHLPRYEVNLAGEPIV
jgi:alanine racemase